ncbi:uncharacterized protein B4U80_14181, partial [Leptotrombidium deliense]
DNGVQFRSDLIAELNKLLNATHKFTTPYNPTTAGLVERTNKDIIQLIKSYIDSDRNNWDDVLPYITFIHNTSFHSSTKFSPFYLVYGFEPKFPIDLVTQQQRVINDPFVHQIESNILNARKNATNNILRSQANYKKNFDERRKELEFNIGDKCLLRYPTITNSKFGPKFIGPFTIVHKINKLVYEIEADDGNLYFDRIHINKLKPYISREHENEINKTDCHNMSNTSNNTKQNVTRISMRKRVVPKYFRDYLLNS